MQMLAVPKEAHDRLVRAAQEVCQSPSPGAARDAAILEMRRAGKAYDDAMRASGYQRSASTKLFTEQLPASA